jgi:triosephosphate isomerase
MIAGNWKMYKTCEEAVAATRTLKSLTQNTGTVDIVIAPPFTALRPVGELLSGSAIGLGAQNMHWQPEGAYTGEVSGPMLLSAGCRYVIIGHSERRHYFKETDRMVNLKIKAAVDIGLIPIFCIGESEQERDAGDTFSVLDKQVKNGLKGFALDELQTLIVAYEPIWAIGTGKTATQQEAQQVHAHLRSWFQEKYGADFAQGVRILYGGSVKPTNIKELMAMPDIDGALVGGASLDPTSFCQLVQYQN